MTPQPTRISSVRQLYDKASEIPYLLSSHTVAAQSTPRVEVAAFVPRVQRPEDDIEIHQDQKENLEPTPQESDREGAEEEDVSVEVDTEATDDIENMEEAVASIDAVLDESLHSNGPSEEQESKIQNVYRRYLRHCSSPALDAETEVIFMTCLKETQSSGWSPGYYRLHFLGHYYLVMEPRAPPLCHIPKCTGVRHTPPVRRSCRPF
ncbi:uncharacterized protein EDB91DRAFT_1247888 [Suillus paluster]|uniref:uncharacterized protein n=1 Tax=Suillus paluster TaxID=48578 RepID=UPI001B8746C5|nr:uncharacterized protein EDB91DRAFT_1247888 [Suillus paluster]KAG1741834.1 hypothetical protein EDB91DRAFT_1247888 [Suillus paluster]